MKGLSFGWFLMGFDGFEAFMVVVAYGPADGLNAWAGDPVLYLWPC